MNRRQLNQRLDKIERLLRRAELLSGDLANRCEGGFDQSKPFNVFYKELQALRWAATVLTGRQSKGAVRERGQAEWGIPDCVKLWLNLKKGVLTK